MNKDYQNVNFAHFNVNAFTHRGAYMIGCKFSCFSISYIKEHYRQLYSPLNGRNRKKEKEKNLTRS